MSLPAFEIHNHIVILNRPQTTTRTQTSVLTHIFALSLHVDNYATDPVVIASDLAMPLKRYALGMLFLTV